MGNPSGSNQALVKIYEAFVNAIRVLPVSGLGYGAKADAIVASYPDTVTEIYEYKSGGVSGTLLYTITVTYTTAAKDLVDTVVRT